MKKHHQSLLTIAIASLCMAVMVFVAAPEESFADGYPYYAKASSQKAGQITLKLYEERAAYLGMGTWNLHPATKWEGEQMAVYQKKGNGAYRRIKVLKSGTKTYTVKNLKKNVKYSFKVISYYKGDPEFNQASLKNAIPTTAVTKDSTKFRNVSKIKLSKKSMTLNYGNSKKLTATLSPSGTKVSKTVKWYVAEGDNGIIKVNQKGKVTALSVGTGYVYAVSHNGVTAKCKVIVKNPKNKKQGFTYKIMSDGVKIFPRKNNPMLWIDYTVTGENQSFEGTYFGFSVHYGDSAYKPIMIKMNKGDKLVVKARDEARGKLIQKYTYTKK